MDRRELIQFEPVQVAFQNQTISGRCLHVHYVFVILDISQTAKLAS